MMSTATNAMASTPLTTCQMRAEPDEPDGWKFGEDVGAGIGAPNEGGPGVGGAGVGRPARRRRRRRAMRSVGRPAADRSGTRRVGAGRRGPPGRRTAAGPLGTSIHPPGGATPPAGFGWGRRVVAPEGAGSSGRRSWGAPVPSWGSCHLVVAMPPSTGMIVPVTYDAGPRREEDRDAGHVVGAADALQRRARGDRVAERRRGSPPSSSTRTGRARWR